MIVPHTQTIVHAVSSNDRRRRIVKIYFKTLASSTYHTLVFMRGDVNLYTKYLQENT